MHLSDAETGKPMYAYENGRYWYAKDQQKGIEYLRAENVKVKDSYFDTLFVKMLPIWKKECIQAMKIINSL